MICTSAICSQRKRIINKLNKVSPSPSVKLLHVNKQVNWDLIVEFEKCHKNIHYTRNKIYINKLVQ